MEINRDVCSSFSVGMETWKVGEIRVMARNSRGLLGPEVFSAERGMLSWQKVDLRVERPCAGGEDGAVTVRKSSWRWTT